MWTDSSVVLQWAISPKNKHQKFIANSVTKFLEYTSVDQLIHVIIRIIPAYVGTRGISAEVSHSSNWARDSEFLRTRKFPFVPNSDLVDEIKLNVETEVQDDDSTSSSSASVTKALKEQCSSPISLDKFSSYQKTPSCHRLQALFSTIS